LERPHDDKAGAHDYFASALDRNARKHFQIWPTPGCAVRRIACPLAESGGHGGSDGASRASSSKGAESRWGISYRRLLSSGGLASASSRIRR
jgi:hypothetical protein